MVSLFLLLGCNLSYIVVLFAALHELVSASARTLLKLASSVHALLKPYGDTLTTPLASMCRAMPFSARALKENIFFDVDIFVKKKHKNVKNRNTVYRVLYSYRQRVRVITLFPNIFFVLFLYVERFLTNGKRFSVYYLSNRPQVSMVL